MKAPDPKIIKDLNTTAQLLAHLSGQYQVDVQQVKAFGLDWLAKRIKKWYRHSECQLRIVISRIIYFGEDPDYNAGETSGADSITQILEREGQLVYAAYDAVIGFRKAAWDIRSDYTPDVYEHVIEQLEKQAIKIDRELNLIKVVGVPGYIGGRLADD